ncbi:glycosyltransferase family 4 protein [Lysinibacter sp. HNR]|uniref:glycosyltransferase family 4 protein n=1 Tax=Lysinibacter sp. HNR TaxID=3031408 RepID=UPI002435F2E6|nr:glycosyltransferase family 4 protein [Lysinibacter sp. HNR]WGD38081.1 glycosyltransferase family 4 protein [Lysinibacter sp. HNR]
MRIVVVNNFFPPRPGGSSHLSESLAIEYAREGNEVLVLTAGYKNTPAKEERDGLTIIRIPSWRLPKNPLSANFDIAFTISPRVKKRVFSVLDSFKPDIIHQHGQFFDLTWISGWWARKHSVPTVLSIHTRLYSPKAINNTIFKVADAILVKPLMRLHKPRLVVMDELMDKYIDKRYSGAHRAKSYIPVGIDPNALRGGNAQKGFERMGLSPDVPIILSIGHVIPQRSRVALMEALPQILQHYPDLKVVIVGGLHDKKFLHKAEALGVTHAVLTLGAQPKSEIPDYLAASKMEIHELEGQGFGTASLEALAAGVPVVACVHTHNFVEVILEDRKHLFITPFVNGSQVKADPKKLADTVIEVLRLSDEAHLALSRASQKLIEENFTIHNVSKQHLEAFHQDLSS